MLHQKGGHCLNEARIPWPADLFPRHDVVMLVGLILMNQSGWDGSMSWLLGMN
jgi:hypothetical protein